MIRRYGHRRELVIEGANDLLCQPAVEPAPELPCKMAFMKMVWVVMVVVLAAARVSSAGTFDWGASCKVPVREERMMPNGSVVKLTYVVALERASERAELRVHMDQMKFASVDGKEDAAREFREVLIMQLDRPTLRISAAGGFLGLADLDALVARILELSFFRSDAGKAERTRKMLLSSRSVERRTTEMNEIWLAWVGAWAGHDLPIGKSISYKLDTSFSEGLLAIPSTIDRIDETHMRLSNHVKGKELAAALGTVYQKADENGFIGTDKATDAERWFTIDVTLDPATLRPREVQVDERRHVTFKDGRTYDVPHRWSTVFDWKAAQGACAAK